MGDIAWKMKVDCFIGSSVVRRIDASFDIVRKKLF